MPMTINEMVISCHPEPKVAEWLSLHEGGMKCSTCGSMHPDEFVWSISNDEFVSGFHWIDNEPLYCVLENNRRFYYRHLMDMSVEWLHAFAIEIFMKTGVLFYWEGDWLKFHSVSEGAYFGLDSAMKLTAAQVKEAKRLNQRYYRNRK